MISFWAFRLGDRTLTVSYAEPKQSEMNQDQVKSVYVGGLTAAATKESLQTFFQGLDNIGEVILGIDHHVSLHLLGCGLFWLACILQFISGELQHKPAPLFFCMCRLTKSSFLAGRMTSRTQIMVLSISKTEAVQSSWWRNVKPARTLDGWSFHQSPALSSRYIFTQHSCTAHGVCLRWGLP